MSQSVCQSVSELDKLEKNKEHLGYSKYHTYPCHIIFVRKEDEY